ncbi:MAG: tellurium resistance protein [Rhodobacteraceae bacterium PARR1]|nr:MAG: tellurium resistance protein [Rhodobacteraceae bacterium PARR1]
MNDPIPLRPKSPPPFPVPRPARFARTPPAVFPVILGLLGLGLALKRTLGTLGLDAGIADAALGAFTALWGFAVFAYAAKMLRRASVVMDDLRVLPGRTGLAALSMGGMLVAAELTAFSLTAAKAVLIGSLALHLVQAVLLVIVLRGSPPEGRMVTPWTPLALVLLALTIPVALVIWAISAVQLIRRIPPAPLRPMLVIHLAPASLFASVAALAGQGALAQGFAALAFILLLLLLMSARWITVSGFSVLWGSFTFPLAACASALILTGWTVAGVVVLVAALGVVPVIAWKVLVLWGSGQLAARTNAAEA